MSETNLNNKPSLGVRFQVLLILVITFPLAWLPFKAANWLGRFMGALGYLFLKKSTKVAVASLKCAINDGYLPPDLNPEQAAREVLSHSAISGLETIKLLHRGLKPFEDLIDHKGRDIVEKAAQEAKAGGKGFILVTGHIGNWEILNQYMNRHFNLRINVVGRVQPFKAVDEIIKRIRTGQGNDFISKDGGAWDMARTIEGGDVLGTLIDQAVRVKNQAVPGLFLGRPALTNNAPVRLARRFNVPLIMVALFRKPDGRYLMWVQPPLKLSGAGDKNAAITDDTNRLNRMLEEMIAGFPGQWQWTYNRWKISEGVYSLLYDNEGRPLFTADPSLRPFPAKNTD